MKRNRKGKRRRDSIQVWTYPQAQSALPYLSSVVRSLRDHTLEALSQQRTAQRLLDRPGRPDRATLIAHEEALKEARRASEQAEEALEALHALDVYSLDPVQGQALVPFVQEEQLAWYVFDLHDAEPLRFWRYQTDPADTRRPVTPAQEGWSETTQLA